MQILGCNVGGVVFEEAVCAVKRFHRKAQQIHLRSRTCGTPAVGTEPRAFCLSCSVECFQGCGTGEGTGTRKKGDAPSPAIVTSAFRTWIRLTPKPAHLMAEQWFVKRRPPPPGTLRVPGDVPVGCCGMEGAGEGTRRDRVASLGCDVGAELPRKEENVGAHPTACETGR